MKIQIFGMGCASCKKLYKLTQETVKEMELDADVEYIDDMQKIVEMGLMSSPVLVVNGKPVVSGFVPDKKGIREALQSEGEFKSSEGGCNCGNSCC